MTSFRRVSDMTVDRVSPADVDEFCHRWHYTAHKGAATWRYGLWDGHYLVGIVAYNLPTGDAQRFVFGDNELASGVLHMGRLACAEHAPRNSESRLISGSLRALKLDVPDCVAVLTFAAASEGHVGYVYQATNAIYTGTSGAPVYYIDPRTGRRMATSHIGSGEARSRGWTVHKERPKHRYVYLLGTPAERRALRARLKLPQLDYPKDDSLLEDE